MKRLNIESFLVMVLFVFFTITIGVFIISGQSAYGRMVEKKETMENSRIALSYINMRIKQNQMAGRIRVEPSVSGSGHMIHIDHFGEEEGYSTYILYEDGILYECYQTTGDPIDLELGTRLLDMKAPVNITYDEETSLLHVQIEGGLSMSVYIYGKAVDDEV